MLSLVVSITYLLCIVAEQLVQRRGAADDRRLLVAVRACIDPRCAGEVTESCGDLRAVLRVEDARTVVLLAEEVARHAHRLMDAPERPVPAAGAARDLGALDVDAAESFRFVHGICRIVRLACCEDCFDSELIINAIVRADAQTLPEAVPWTVSVVPHPRPPVFPSSRASPCGRSRDRCSYAYGSRRRSRGCPLP